MVRSLKAGETLLTLVIGAFGIGMIVVAARFKELRLSMIAGPEVFPIIIGAFFICLAFGMAVQIARRRQLFVDRPEEVPGGRARGVRALAFAAAGIVGFGTLVRPAGVIVAGTVLFVLVMLAFEHRKPLRAALAGVIVSTAIYAVFNGLFGLHLPGGPIDLVLPR